MRMGRFVRGLVCTALCVCMTATTAFAQITPSAGKSGAAAAEAVNVEATSGDDDETTAELASASTVKKLNTKKIGLDDSRDRIVISKSKNGIYFVNYVYDQKKATERYDVIFYSLDNGTYKKVFTRATSSSGDDFEDRVDDVYCDDNGIYMYHTKTKRKLEYYYGYEYYKTTGYETYVESYNFITGKTSSVDVDMPLDSSKSPYGCSCLGVDGKGRIYVASSSYNGNTYIYLFSKKGKYLSKCKMSSDGIYGFCGFDSKNGNFYYTGEDPDYWYYSCLMAGNVSSNKIRVKNENIATMSSSSGQPVEMLNGKYLAVLLKGGSDECMILNSNSYKYTDTVKMNDSWYSDDVDPLNVSNKKIRVMTIDTAVTTYDKNGTETSGVGPRCAINSAGTAIIAKTADKTLTEYSLKTKKQVVQHATKYSVYTFAMTDDNECVAVEKKGNSYYVEKIDWSRPATFSISYKNSVEVGDTDYIKCSTAEGFIMSYTFSSSDTNVLSVDSNGKINAWKKGTAKITVKSPTINKTKTVTVKVKNSEASKSSAYSSAASAGATSKTIHSTDFGEAYLTQLSNGYFQRVEYVRGKVVIETYDKSYSLRNVRKIKNPMDLWGGYYSGKKYNYLVFGQSNTKESNKKVVIKVIKYNKSWKKLGTCNIKGANTVTPFHMGDLDMTEAGGKLYIHTCHLMYTSDDGLNHQANCTFVIKQKNMKLVDSYYDVMNISYGYVSHSFRQRIDSDGKYVYRVDLGDAYPDGVAFSRTPVSGKIYSPDIYGVLQSDHMSYKVGDVKLSTDNYLVTGTGKKSSKSNTNIYVIASSKDELGSKVKWITNYKSDSKAEVCSPKLVKLQNDQFLLLWEEATGKRVKDSWWGYSYEYTYKTKMVLIDEWGEMKSKIYSTTMALSSCEPILTKTGKVVWYVTNNSSPTFVEINPYKLATVQSKTKSDKTFAKTSNTYVDYSSAKGYRTGDMAVVKKRIYKLTSSSTVALCGVVGSVPATLTIGKTVKIGGKSYKITSIATRALKGWTNLKKLVIGGNVKTIGSYAFMGCTSLSSVSIGGNVEKIGSKAFAGCKKLKTVSIKTKKLSKSKVGASAFKGIYSKATFKLPSSKVKSYKSILLKKGATKKMKFKKL